MTRVYYRLSLAAVCALAAFGGPIWFLEDRPRPGYLAGGLAAALLTWAILALAMAAEPNLQPWLQGAVGLGAAVLSWATISLVAVFDVIPHAMRYGLSRFDPVWIAAGGLAPLVILGVAAWRVGRDRLPVWHTLLSTLFRYSVPLLGLHLTVRFLPLPKQYRWLFLFTGVMFLVLDAIGSGGDLPLSRRRDDQSELRP
ncbi:MAG TPA: hypothetical protein VK464_07315 [Symbiobacteriaceae bacterium]|nr:hypothetical protein [Symbiobacteriaceae bacterium]